MRAPSGVCHGRRDEDRALAADDLDLVAAMDVHAAVDRGEHVAREAQHAGEARVDAVAAEHLLAAHALGLGAGDQRARR